MSITFDRPLTERTNNYSYLAESTAAQKNSKLQAQMYFPETNGEIDQNTETNNKALAKRIFYSKGGNLFEMVPPLLVRTIHASQQPTPYSVCSFLFYLLDVTILFRRFTYKDKQCLLRMRIIMEYCWIVKILHHCIRCNVR